MAKSQRILRKIHLCIICDSSIHVQYKNLIFELIILENPLAIATSYGKHE